MLLNQSVPINVKNIYPLLLEQLHANLIMIYLFELAFFFFSQAIFLQLEFNKLIEFGRYQCALKLSIVLKVI
jgi:hypothetical protein